MTGPPLDPALSADLCTDHAHNLPSPWAAFPRPSQSMHFSDVSKMNGLKDSLRPRDLKHIGCAQ